MRAARRRRTRAAREATAARLQLLEARKSSGETDALQTVKHIYASFREFGVDVHGYGDIARFLKARGDEGR